MLKKAGIIVAASAASLLAVSPLAFAGDYAGDSSKDGKHHDGGIDKSADGGLVGALNGNNINVPIQVCNNNVPVNVLGAQVPVEDASLLNGLTGALDIAGDVKSKSGDSATDQSDACAVDANAGDSVG